MVVLTSSLPQTARRPRPLTPSRPSAPSRDRPQVPARVLLERVRIERDLRDGILQRGARERAQAGAVAAALAQLAAGEDLASVIDAVPAVLCRSLGFSRVMVSRVSGSAWVPEAFFVDPAHVTDVFEGFDRYRGVELPLRRLHLETELVRRRIPLLVMDPHADPRAAITFLRDAKCRSYVVAPVIIGGRVVGFFHADRMGQAEPVDVIDRDALARFADQMELLVECVTLRGRLRRQTRELTALIAAATAASDGVAGEELALVRRELQARGTAPARREGPPPAVTLLLSTRELEVLELVASGATNNDIAAALAITTGTVKSHVKRVLRKTRVTNRAEAAAWYHRQVGEQRRRAAA